MKSLPTHDQARDTAVPVEIDYGAEELLRITMGTLNARPRFRMGHVDRDHKFYPAGTQMIRDSYHLASAIERCLARGALPLEARELAAVLAGLRTLQEGMIRGADDLPAHLVGIATDGGRCRPLSLAEIDHLCERLNAGA